MVELVLNGTGFKCFILEENLFLETGTSHYIMVKADKLTKAKKKTILTSPQLASLIFKIKKPNPYKLRGIYFKNKIFKLKPGKKKK